MCKENNENLVHRIYGTWIDYICRNSHSVGYQRKSKYVYYMNPYFKTHFDNKMK